MIFKISSLCQCESVCVMDAQTIRPIVSKLGLVIEGGEGGQFFSIEK